MKEQKKVLFKVAKQGELGGGEDPKGKPRDDQLHKVSSKLTNLS